VHDYVPQAGKELLVSCDLVQPADAADRNITNSFTDSKPTISKFDLSLTGILDWTPNYLNS